MASLPWLFLVILFVAFFRKFGAKGVYFPGQDLVPLEQMPKFVDTIAYQELGYIWTYNYLEGTGNEDRVVVFLLKWSFKIIINR